MPNGYLTIEHLTIKQITRIFNTVEISKTNSYEGAPCWDWTGRLSDNGYPKSSYKHRDERAHRLVYAWLVESIPRGLGKDVPQLDHLCDNKKCVNPAHLKLTTARENNMRGGSMSAQHARKTHCKNGHEFTPENTRYVKGRSHRFCATCADARWSARYHNDPEFAARCKENARRCHQRRKAKSA